MKKMKKVTIMMIVILVSLSTTIFAQQNDASQKKTKGYIVFAMGFNTLSNSEKAIYNNLEMVKSRFYEIGYARNTRLSKKDNLLHLNYGVSLVFNNIRLKNGHIFKSDADSQTYAIVSPEGVSKTRLRNYYLQVPVYLEFDFTSDEKMANPNKISKKGFKIGVGGFLGFKMNTKQFIDYNDGKEETQKNNLNVRDFTYGIGTYIGYSFASFYVKYDIQGMFEHNTSSNPRNVSFGFRIDL